MAKCRLALLFGLLLGVLAGAEAQAGDGAIRWRTLRAPGIELTFPADYEAFAQRVLATWRDAALTLGALLPARGGTLQLTIDDYVDTANGFASVVPYDHVHLYAYPPEPDSALGDHGDWLRALIFHEYSHVLHMGAIAGPPTWINAVIGRTLMPNANLPRFFTEGLATWVETRLTGGDRAVTGQGGRVGSPPFMAILRANVLADNLPELSELTGTLLRWPRGTAWYLYGSWLVDDVARRRGATAIRRFVDGIAPRLFGYGMQGVARDAWGVSLTRAWRDAADRLRTEIVASWRARLGADLPDPSTPAAALEAFVRAADGEPLTRDGEFRGRLRPWPDGGSAIVVHGARDAPLFHVERVFADGRHVALHACAGDCDEVLVTPDARWLLYTETRRFQRLYAFRELMAVPLNDGVAVGAPLRLTRGARLRAPSLSADGSALVAVRVVRGRTEIAELPLAAALAAAQDGGDPPQWQTRVPAAPLGETLDSPLRLADGTLVWTAWRGNRRALVGECQLARDAADAAWIGDLQRLEAGEVGAVVEVAGYREAATWRPGLGWRLRTRTLTGIAAMTAVAGRVWTVRHGARGLDVFLAPKERADALPGPHLPALELAYAPTPVNAREGMYNPLTSLYPRAWRPLLTATGDRDPQLAGGFWLGAQLRGQDALAHWGFLLTGQIRDDGSDPIGSLTATYAQFEPTFQLDLGYQQGFAYLRRGFGWATTPTDRWGVGLRGQWEIPGVREAWTFGLGWRLVQSSLRDDRLDLRFPYDPGGPAPVEPWTGIDAFVDGEVAYGWSASSPDAITTERNHAFSLKGSWGDRWTGGGRRRFISQLNVANRWPLGARFVAEITNGLALVPVSGDSSPGFASRGIQPLPTQLLAGSGTSAITVRGLPWDRVLRAGDGMAFGTLQVHVPVWDIGRGFDTLPLTLGRLRATPFVDAAYAFWPAPFGQTLAGGTWSSGAELLLGWQAGYALNGTLRLGVGHAFAPQNTAGWLILGL